MAEPGPATHSPAPVEVDPATLVEREALKLAIQVPLLAGHAFDAVDESFYLRPLHISLRAALAAAGGASSAATDASWVEAVRNTCSDPNAQALIAELAAEPLRIDGDPDPRYVTVTLSRLQLHAVNRQIDHVKAMLRESDPTVDPDEHVRIFGELVSLERQTRELRRVTGGW
jgi:DNA primase